MPTTCCAQTLWIGSFLIDRLHIAPEKITPILHPAGPEFSRVAQRRRYDRPCTKIIFSGTWTERKGIRQLAEAFSILASRYPALELGILGAGVPAGARAPGFFRGTSLQNYRFAGVCLA